MDRIEAGRAMNELEERLYAQAAGELASKTPAAGLMAKAFADADGDEKRAFARYITLRVEQLKDQLRQDASRQRAEEARQRPMERLRAWRRTAQGREDWIIQAVDCGLRIVKTATQEELTVSRKNLEFAIEFHPHAFVHKIILINRWGGRFSLNAHSSTVKTAQAWWNSSI